MINKDEIKNNLEKILIYYGAVPSKSDGMNWNCIPSRHGDSKEDLTVKGNICCCHCGIQGDSFSVIGELENLDYRNKKDFLLIAKKASEILNLPVNKNNYYSPKSNNYKEKEKQKKKNVPNFDLTKIITENFKRANKNQYMYFFKRGLSFQVMSRYKMVVSNPRKVFPLVILPKLNNIWAYEYIIPVWKDGKVVNCILRRNDLKSKNNKKTLNLKGYNVEIINLDYLKENNLEYVFICEGWADAMSFENLGHKAIALNSVTMINRLIETIKENINNLKNVTFFVIFDIDQKGWGQIWAKKLIAKLIDLNLNAYNLKIKNQYKDVNDYYVKDINSFKSSINNLLEKIRKVFVL